MVNTASLAGLTSPGMLGPYNVTKHWGGDDVGDPVSRPRGRRLPGGRVGPLPRLRPDPDRRVRPNRPEWAPAAAVPRASNSRVSSATGGRGNQPADVAEKVLYAVRHNRFYIITHDDTPAMVETRLRDIIEGRNPSGAPIG